MATNLMKQIQIVLIAMLMVGQYFAMNDAVAHPGHDHVLTKDQAIVRGSDIVSSFVKKETPVAGQSLDESWVDGNNPMTCHSTPLYFLIAVKNRTTGKSVFLLLTSAGKFLRAKFDRDFAELIFSSYPVQAC